MELDNSGLFYRPQSQDRVKMRILPVSNDSGIFQTHRIDGDPITDYYRHAFGKSIKPQERYYHTCVVKGQEEKGPQVLAVGRAVHQKIVEALTNPPKPKLRWYQKVAACVRWFFEKINVLRPVEPELEPCDFILSRDQQGFVRIDPA